MRFFQRKSKGTINAMVKVADVFVLTCMVVSSHNDGTGCGPMCVTMYFLAKSEDGKWYELFSGKKLETEDELFLKTFDTPYVQKAEPLTKYLKNPNKVTMEIHSLFDFITNMNVLAQLGVFHDEDNTTENV